MHVARINNSGQTAVIEALALRFGDKLATAPLTCSWG